MVKIDKKGVMIFSSMVAMDVKAYVKENQEAFNTYLKNMAVAAQPKIEPKQKRRSCRKKKEEQAWI